MDITNTSIGTMDTRHTNQVAMSSPHHHHTKKCKQWQGLEMRYVSSPSMVSFSFS